MQEYNKSPTALGNFEYHKSYEGSESRNTAPESCNDMLSESGNLSLPQTLPFRNASHSSSFSECQHGYQPVPAFSTQPASSPRQISPHQTQNNSPGYEQATYTEQEAPDVKATLQTSSSLPQQSCSTLGSVSQSTFGSYAPSAEGSYFGSADQSLYQRAYPCNSSYEQSDDYFDGNMAVMTSSRDGRSSQYNQASSPLYNQTSTAASDIDIPWIQTADSMSKRRGNIQKAIPGHQNSFLVPKYESYHRNGKIANRYKFYFQIGVSNAGKKWKSIKDVIDTGGLKLCKTDNEKESRELQRTAEDSLKSLGFGKVNCTYATEHVFEIQTLRDFLSYIHRIARGELISAENCRIPQSLTRSKELALEFIEERPRHRSNSNSQSIVNRLAACVSHDNIALDKIEFVYLAAPLNNLKATLFGHLNISSLSSWSSEIEISKLKTMYLLLVVEYLRDEDVQALYKVVSDRMRTMIAHIEKEWLAEYEENQGRIFVRGELLRFFDDFEESSLQALRANINTYLHNAWYKLGLEGRPPNVDDCLKSLQRSADEERQYTATHPGDIIGVPDNPQELAMEHNDEYAPGSSLNSDPGLHAYETDSSGRQVAEADDSDYQKDIDQGVGGKPPPPPRKHPPAQPAQKPKSNAKSRRSGRDGNTRKTRTKNYSK